VLVRNHAYDLDPFCFRCAGANQNASSHGGLPMKRLIRQNIVNDDEVAVREIIGVGKKTAG
jgi:hypothetical protein